MFWPPLEQKKMQDGKHQLQEIPRMKTSALRPGKSAPPICFYTSARTVEWRDGPWTRQTSRGGVREPKAVAVEEEDKNPSVASMDYAARERERQCAEMYFAAVSG